MIATKYIALDVKMNCLTYNTLNCAQSEVVMI